MRAAYCKGYGGPEQVEVIEVERPNIKPDEILIKIHASAVNSADVRTRALKAPIFLKPIMRLVMGIRRPRQPILGNVLAGTVIQTGERISQWKVGDRVYGSSGGFRYGSHAEYIALKGDSMISPMPKKASFEQAVSLVFGGMAALWFLENMEPKDRQKLLVYGASGAVGTMAVQLGKVMGLQVTGVSSGANKQFVLGLGADKFYDYQNDLWINIHDKYDLVFDAVGKLPKSKAKRFLKPEGKYQTVGGLSVAKESLNQLHQLTHWYCNDRIKAVIDRVYPLEDIAQAHEYVDQGHKKGSVVVRIAAAS